VRIGVIEVGHWHSGKYINRAIDLGLEIVAVSDHSFETAQQRANQLGCRAYTDYMDLLHLEAPDFVFAHGIHREMTDIADALVEHGTPFVMEKPMGVDWRRLAVVADKAEHKGLFAGVDLPSRCEKLICELMRLKDAGDLGRVNAYSQRLLAGEPRRYRDWNVPWVLDPTQAGGGPLFNFGPHLIDLFLLLSGQEVQSVFCRSSRALHELDIEDYSSVLLSTTEDAIASLEVGYVCPDSMYDQLLSLCTDRLFVSTNSLNDATIHFRDGRTMELSPEGEGLKLDYVAETFRRLRDGEPPVASVRDMCRALRVINAAVESAKANEPVILK
jgi:predicted dehydrogenase